MVQQCFLENTDRIQQGDTPRHGTVGRATLPDTVLWEPDPRPLMTNHPPQVTDSNIRIPLSEGSLNSFCPKDDSGLGWVQIQRKSLFWEEKIDGFSIITHEGLTTLAHPQIGWTITSGMWLFGRCGVRSWKH